MSTNSPTPTVGAVVVGPWSENGRRVVAALAAHADRAKVVAAVSGPADRRTLPNVPTFRTFQDLIEGVPAALLPPIRLLVIADHGDPAPLVRQALLAGWHVLCEWPFTRNRAEAEELYALAHERHLTLVLGRANRIMVAQSLGLTPGRPGSGVTQVDAWHMGAVAAPVPLLRWQDELPLGAALVDLLALALVLVERGGRATVTVPRGGSIAATIEIAGGPRLTLRLGGGGAGPARQRLDVRGPHGDAKLMLPTGAAVPPPSTVKSHGVERVLSLPPIADCDVRLVAVVLRLLTAGRPTTWDDDLRLMVLLDALGRALESRSRSVVVDLP
jgi:hypothetical protein